MSDRFMDKVEKLENGCWQWTAGKDYLGYGRFQIASYKNVVAHRVSYERFVGPIPEGLELDHLCRNRGCVNPEHLEPVDHRTNVLRGTSLVAVGALRSTCARGHELTPENTYASTPRRRQCKACARERAMRTHERIRSKKRGEAVS